MGNMWNQKVDVFADDTLLYSLDRAADWCMLPLCASFVYSKLITLSLSLCQVFQVAWQGTRAVPADGEGSE